MSQRIATHPERKLSLTVAIDADVRQVLIDRAAAEQRSIGSVVRTAVDAYLHPQQKETDSE